jgi:hypothetical protein
MRIGILTFHCAHNYGAVLQAYALREELKLMGYDVEFVNYQPEYLLSPYSIDIIKGYKNYKPSSFFSTIKYIGSEIILFRRRFIRYWKFNKFIKKKLSIRTKPIKNVVEIDKDYDAYIFGSDQIWNLSITKGFDDIFWGNFIVKKNAKKISYAASMDTEKIQEYALIKSRLSNFDYLSVRENQLKNLLQPLCYKEINTVLDPTLLVSPQTWNSFIKKPNIKKKYVLVYQVRETPQTLRIANEIASQIGGVVIRLVAFFNSWKYGKNLHQSEGPEEFVNWIKYAECVVTTSFHGTAFSIIFNKPFYTLKLSDGSDSRAKNLLIKFNLSDRFISPESNINLTDIDYTNVNSKLNELRSLSKSFLINSLD